MCVMLSPYFYIKKINFKSESQFPSSFSGPLILINQD